MEAVRVTTSGNEYFGAFLSDAPQKFKNNYGKDLVGVQLTAFLAEVGPLNKALEKQIETLSSRHGVKGS